MPLRTDADASGQTAAGSRERGASTTSPTRTARHRRSRRRSRGRPTRGSRSGRARRLRAGSPRARRSTRAGSRSRWRPLPLGDAGVAQTSRERARGAATSRRSATRCDTRRRSTRNRRPSARRIVEEVDERAPAHAMNYDLNLMALPPVFAASALYDNLLQSALRQFFGRATFESEPTPSLSSDGRLAIEPTTDPSELTIRWFGSRHVLHVPRGAGRSRSTRFGSREPSAACSRCAIARSSIRGRCSSAAICSAARSRIATSARSSTAERCREGRRGRAAISSRPRSKCSASRRCRATRTARFRPACC